MNNKMKHIIMPKNVYQCFIYSAAMVLDTTTENIINIIGHTGETKVFEGSGTKCCKGVHYQELIDCAMSLGLVLVHIEANPRVGNIHGDSIEVFEPKDGEKRFTNYITKHKSILTGMYPPNKVHALACDGEYIYDPCGPKEKLKTTMFEISSALILIE